MNESLLDAKFVGTGRRVELGAAAEEADRQAWGSAAAALGQRRYGATRVVADWPATGRGETFTLPIRIAGSDDPAAAAELFLHDVFLMFNLAAPGSFGGTISLGERDELTLDARLFEYAWATAARHGRPRIAPIALPRVVAWYDALAIDAAQAAERPVARALFQLLHLSRGAEDELLSLVRLAEAAEALGIAEPKLAALRDGPVRHPAVVDEKRLLERIDAADAAASAVVSAIQELIRTFFSAA